MVLKLPAKKYTDKSIKVLSTMDSLRAKMSMYLGGRDSVAIFQCAKEVVDNSIDEFSQGRGNIVRISVNDSEITVSDNANGIPVGITKDPDTGKKVNTLTAIFTKLHAGGKFSSGAYGKGSKGTHGIGVTAVNAVSEFLSVHTVYKGVCWHQKFKNGVAQADPVKSAKPKFNGIMIKGGTLITFKPNPNVFVKGSKLPITRFKNYLELLSYIHSGVTIELYVGKEKTTYYQKDGLKALLNVTLTKLGAEPIGKPMVINAEGVNCILQWSSHTDENVSSYVNGSLTAEGGTHVRGLLDALNKSLEPFKTARSKFTPQDLRSGLVCILNCSVVEPEFSSQTKERLTTAETTKKVFDIAKPAFDAFFASNKTFVKTIMKRAEDMLKVRMQYTASKKALAGLRSAKAKFSLTSKLAPCESKNYKENELFITEGNGAGGSAKMARDRKFQAILPLRGKPLNAYGKQSAKLLANAEVRDILQAIGYDGDAKAIDKLKFGKIILLADADVDGKHITVLITTILQRVVPDLFKRGMVYTVDAPLFITRLKSGLVGANSLKELKAKMGKEKGRITRLKGWGEANPEELGPLALDKSTRKLIKIKPLETNGEVKEFVGLLGDDKSAKSKLLGI